MAARFKTFSFHAMTALPETNMDAPAGLARASSARTSGPSLPEATGGRLDPEGLPLAEPPLSDEAAARHLAAELLGAARDPDLDDIIAPDVPELVPGLAMTRSEEDAGTGTRTVHFEQRVRRIPVFGTSAVVEIDAVTRELVSFDAALASVPDISGIAALSPAAALAALAEHGGASPETLGEVDPPTLCFFAESEGAEWHLAYHFRSVPMGPPEIVATIAAGHGGHGHGLGASPRENDLRYDYLVDARSGSVVYYFSSQPRLDLPVLCSGTDELGNRQQFFGRANGSGFELVDPLRQIETFDHGLNDIAGAPPASAIAHAATDFGTVSTAGVSAHCNAALVSDFLATVLKRNGIDGKGMAIRSVVNCTYRAHHHPPDWPNAVWWRGRMWYGQTTAAGGLESYARFLDVIAHELTHGVTEHTSDLVYRDESGALNESFSDIFGVIVANWYPGRPQPLAGWNWQIGAGLGQGGLPLRDMSDPTRTGHPDHWHGRQYIGTTYDDGGVHYNSGIHNKAAYNLFHEAGSGQTPTLSPEEIGLFYYLALTRLTRRARFVDVRRTLRAVAASYFRGDAARTAAALTAIDNAYDAVGIL